MADISIPGVPQEILNSLNAEIGARDSSPLGVPVALGFFSVGAGRADIQASANLQSFVASGPGNYLLVWDGILSSEVVWLTGARGFAFPGVTRNVIVLEGSGTGELFVSVTDEDLNPIHSSFWVAGFSIVAPTLFTVEFS